MNIKWLEYFLTISESKNMTQAAEKLYVSLPSLSNMMKRLEEEIGFQLFDRSGREIKLSVLGKKFMPYAEKSVESLSAGITKIRFDQLLEQNIVRIATTTSLVSQPIFTGFKMSYPMIVLSSDFINLNMLQDPRILQSYDFLITSPDDWKKRSFDEEHILYDNDYPVVLVSKEHRLSKRHNIKLKEIRNESFIALYENYSSRHMFNRLFRLAGFEPNIIMECDYLMRSHMVGMKFGISIGTMYSAICENNPDIVAIPIVEPYITRTQSIFWVKDEMNSEAKKTFLKFVKNYKIIIGHRISDGYYPKAPENYKSVV